MDGNGWMPIDELPEHDSDPAWEYPVSVRVIVAVPQRGEDDEPYYFARYDFEFQCWNTDNGGTVRPTHWRPSPPTPDTAA